MGCNRVLWQASRWLARRHAARGVAAVLILVSTTWAAQAQFGGSLTPAPPVTGADISNYCIFENKTYSPGALTCDVTLKPSNAPMECQAPDNNHKRAYWKIVEGNTLTCR
jgi:hypothetical protein